MFSRAHNSKNLILAAQNNDLEAVLDLMWACDPKDNDSAAFRAAAAHGSLECLQALKTVSDITARNAEALYWAARNGHLPCVTFLWNLSVVHLNKRGYEALLGAATHNQVETARFIVGQGINPAQKQSQPLAVAIIEGHQEMVNFLVPLSNPEQALEQIMRLGHSYAQYGWYKERLEAQRQKDTLRTHLANSTVSPANRKL